VRQTRKYDRRHDEKSRGDYGGSISIRRRTFDRRNIFNAVRRMPPFVVQYFVVDVRSSERSFVAGITRTMIPSHDVGTTNISSSPFNRPTSRYWYGYHWTREKDWRPRHVVTSSSLTWRILDVQYFCVDVRRARARSTLVSQSRHDIEMTNTASSPFNR
jgi:hypothetical protein